MARLHTLLAACCIPASLAFVAAASPQPLFLVNRSDSEPPGLYVRAPLPAGRGRLVAFRTPSGGRAYADANLPELARGGILKTFIGAPGDLVCAQAGVLLLNGRQVGPIRAVDRLGRALPQWRGCRWLAADEHVAISTRIPNSFDSRYFGPVKDSDIIGVYEPLWVRR